MRYDIRRMPAPDRVHRVVDREVHDGHAASGMDGGRLGARRLEDLEQRAVPLDDLIRLTRITRSMGRPGSLEREIGTQKRDGEQRLCHWVHPSVGVRET